MFAFSDRAERYQSDLLAFMDECFYPAEPVYEEQMRAAGDRTTSRPSSRS